MTSTERPVEPSDLDGDEPDDETFLSDAPSAVRRCFIARPISMPEALIEEYSGREKHWEHVQEYLLKPALRRAGYEVVSPVSIGASLINADIVENLNDSELVLADFSTLNPNVLYEAGLRTAINKPLVIVAQVGTKLPFDTLGVNTFFYEPALHPWVLVDEVSALTDHIAATDPAGNALWRRFGIALKSGELELDESPGEARLLLLTEAVRGLTRQVQDMQRRLPASDLAPSSQQARRTSTYMRRARIIESPNVPVGSEMPPWSQAVETLAQLTQWTQDGISDYRRARAQNNDDANSDRDALLMIRELLVEQRNHQLQTASDSSLGTDERQVFKGLVNRANELIETVDQALKKG